MPQPIQHPKPPKLANERTGFHDTVANGIAKTVGSMYVDQFNTAAARPQNGGEMGWILETNTAMNRGMEAMGGRVVKRYRVYERVLESPPADA